MIDYSRSSKQTVLDRRYLNDISQISGVPLEDVVRVFDIYNCYLLRDIAISYKPKDVIYIPVPGFCTMRITPTTHKNSQFGHQVHLTKGIKGKFKQKIQNALENDHDYLDDYCYNKFKQLIEGQVLLNGEKRRY